MSSVLLVLSAPRDLSPTFVLAVESEKFPHPRDYAQAYAEESNSLS